MKIMERDIESGGITFEAEISAADEMPEVVLIGKFELESNGEIQFRLLYDYHLFRKSWRVKTNIGTVGICRRPIYHREINPSWPNPGSESEQLALKEQIEREEIATMRQRLRKLGIL
jgi:hypothetical protein